MRRSLSAAGFNVKRIPGFGSKWHMVVARLRSAE
jgi:tRNA U34 5-methylaminomethyl-2-thiouridine-forming methyltransferase MnmC